MYFQLNNIKPASSTILSGGVFLVLLNTAKVPPHLGLMANGKWYSLEASGPTINGSISGLLKFISQKNVQTIFIGLSIKNVLVKNDLNEIITKLILQYPKVDVGIATCLTPIKDFCSSVYNLETSNINFVYELIPLLEKNNTVTGIYEMNLSSKLNNETFKLKKYSLDDIFSSIRNYQTI